MKAPQGSTTTGLRTALLLIVLYLRVSTQDQGKSGYSLPEQEIACRRKAEELVRGWERDHGPVEAKILVYHDDISGDFDREIRGGLDDALTMCHEQSVEWFLCLDPDRLGRKAHLSLSISEAVERTGTKLAFVLHEYQMSPEGRLFFSLRVSVAEYEKAKILERTNRGKRGARRKGRIPNNISCYGYHYRTRAELDKAAVPVLDANGVNHQLVINEAEAAWVREMFRWVREERIGPKLIAYRLNGMGIETKRGGRWNRGVIYCMLRNTTFCGRMIMNKYNFSGLGVWTNVRPEKRPPIGELRPALTPSLRAEEEWVEVRVPAIVGQDEFDAVQETLSQSARQARTYVTNEGNERPKRRSFLLSGVGRCGLCGGTLQYAWNNKINDYYIRCVNKFPEKRALMEPLPKCPGHVIRATEFEAEVWQTLLSWFNDPELLRKYHDSRKARAPTHTSQSEERIRTLNEQTQALQAERARVILMFRKGKLSEAQFDRDTDTLDDQIAEVRRSIQDAERGLSDVARRDSAVELLVETIQSMRESMVTMLDRMNLAQRQHLVRTVFHSVRKVKGQPAEYDI